MRSAAGGWAAAREGWWGLRGAAVAAAAGEGPLS